jgi:predicted dienelactone hydrolase
MNGIPTFTPASTATPNASPAQIGPYDVNRLILGEELHTQGLEQPITPSVENLNLNYFECIDGQVQNVLELPSRVNAAVYYPVYRASGANVTDHRVPTPNPLNLTLGPYPILLYAHGYRSSSAACTVASPVNRDFTTIDFILRHVASYGVVCVAPNLSWVRTALGGVNTASNYAEHGAYWIRSRVLMSYWLYLASQLNTSLFAQQLDLSNVILVGHSTGAGGATQAGRELSKIVSFRSIAYGLVAPVSRTTIPLNLGEVRNLLVLGGTVDTLQGADPQDAYTTASAPKTLVTIPGANHFGFTDLCDGNNVCQPYGVNDPAGTIARADQQLAGAAYLAALARYYALDDKTARPYLTGERAVEGLEALSIQVQQKGYRIEEYRTPPPTGWPTLEPVGP